MGDSVVELPVKSWSEGCCEILQPGASIFADNFGKLKELLNQLASEKKKNIILDLEFVDTIDSSGLGLIVSALSRIREQGGKLVLCGVNPYLRKILRLIVLPVEKDLPGAIKTVMLEE